MASYFSGFLLWKCVKVCSMSSSNNVACGPMNSQSRPDAVPAGAQM
jgi:hypothetical protein